MEIKVDANVIATRCMVELVNLQRMRGGLGKQKTHLFLEQMGSYLFQ